MKGVYTVNKTSVTEVMSTSLDNIFHIPEGEYVVTYADGVDTAFKKEIIFNRYVWELFSVVPNTPIVIKCSIKNILNRSYYTSDTHKVMLEYIFKYICEASGLYTYAQKEPLLYNVYRVYNLIYNDLLYRISDYVTTISAMDFIDVVNMPEIVTIHENTKPNPDSIEKAYKDIKTTLTSITDSSNRFIHAYKSKSINENQSNQCIGPRGFVTDIDRSVFKKPIMSGFIKGLDTLFEFIAESRTAAKALNASDRHIAISEYTSRRFQLVSMVVERIVPGDCGSTEYFNFFVGPGTLDNLKGKYYFNDSLGKLVMITGNETELVNTIIKLRTSLGCKLPNSKQICSTCVGEIGNNFKEDSNIGYTAIAYLMEKISQSILSTKHLVHSVRKSVIKLSGEASRYFNVTPEGYLYFNKETPLKGLKLVLYAAQVNKLIDVLNLIHTHIALNKIGEVSDIAMIDSNQKNPVPENISMTYKDRNCILTKDLLEYIKNLNPGTDAKGNFVIPLDDFDTSRPVFFNPLKEKNIMSFVSKLARIVETNSDKVSDPYAKLDMAFTHITDQLKCNISVIEILIYATTTFNVFNNDFRLGRNSQHPRTETENVIYKSRSLSQMFVYKLQIKALYNNGFNIFNSSARQDHPFDILFMPQEALMPEIVNKS